MSSFSGIGGYATIDTFDPSAGSSDLCIQSWTINFNVTVEEYPCLNDATGYKQQLVSVDYTSTGSIECSYDSEGGLDLNDLVGSQADIVLFTGQNFAYSGTGTITGASVNISGGRNTSTINFTSSSAWTEVTPPP